MKICSTSDLISFLIFHIFHDLHDFISQPDTQGLPTLSEMFEEFTIFFIYILYADDTVLVAESAQQFQNQLLNHFENYRKK